MIMILLSHWINTQTNYKIWNLNNWVIASSWLIFWWIWQCLEEKLMFGQFSCISRWALPLYKHLSACGFALKWWFFTRICKYKKKFRWNTHVSISIRLKFWHWAWTSMPAWGVIVQPVLVFINPLWPASPMDPFLLKNCHKKKTRKPWEKQGWGTRKNTFH